MTRNNLIGDSRVFQAAMSLAKMVKDSGKPVVFDMDRYMEIVLGHSAPQLGEHLDKYMHGMTDAATDDERRKIRADLSRLQSEQASAHVLKHHFTEALSDAFTVIEVHAVCPCSIFEIGHTADFNEGLLLSVEGKGKDEDEGDTADAWDEGATEDAWVFMVIRSPSPNEVGYIPL